MNGHEGNDSKADTPERLRLAVLLDSDQQPAWVYAMLERTKSLSFVEFSLVIKRIEATPNDRSSALWGLYRRADDRLFGRAADALAVRDVSGLLRDVPFLEINSITNSVAGFDHHNIDVVLDISLGFIPDTLAGFARYGVWRYAFGNAPLHEPSEVGRSEVFEQAPLTFSSLASLLPDGQVVCLYRSQSRTVPF